MSAALPFTLVPQWLRSPGLARYLCRELSKTWWLAPVYALQIAAAGDIILSRGWGVQSGLFADDLNVGRRFS
jgi:hypothetical protein